MARLSSIIIGFWTVLTLSIGLSAQDTKIPEALIGVEHQKCMRSCVPSVGEVACKALCDCTMQEFQKRMDFERFLDLAAELARNEIGPESRQLLDSIALYCADQVEKSGVDLSAEPKAQEPN
ncbi:hypothetical protein [Kordiimonas sp. SCSIO 12610]|uniref:hypothetical protein n=1 Tax=Kordiimonas sp. SCSIO 12610 TaxID=2829597 RepID=UPI002109C010|nr:hypothetical protein [Kordiimonas sp. SCSIO 12610]UTW54411.1 hypothetical protein KFF44_11390 [Kordiimonas sp. SCSIO 12610]